MMVRQESWMTFRLLLLTAFSTLTAAQVCGAATLIEVDASKDKGEFHHFWRSTGFTPAKLLLEAPMQQQMAYAGGVPNDENV